MSKRHDLIVFPTDKNLGPSNAERTPYIRQVLTEHLLNETNYEFIREEQASIELAEQRERFLLIYGEWKHTLPSEAEETYFKRATKAEYLNKTRVPQFYGTYKVHKGGKPKTRPILSCVNSVPEIFSKWVDYWLKKVVRTILPTYVRDAEHLMTELKNTFPNGLPVGAKLFSVDAIAMYSSIETEHGIEVVTEWLQRYRADLPKCMPVDFIIAALSEIMKNNIFQFGNTFWRQKDGTAMGTSAAVNYAYLYVGLLEILRLLEKYEASLAFFKRFIDDGIGVWIPNSDDPLAWPNFFEALNSWGKLKWTCDGHVNSLVFLDLRIAIGPDRHLLFETYQKPMNLYLYIPPGSSHPKNMLRGLVLGRLCAYQLQNSS